MKTKIIEKLKSVEINHNIKVLFAIESGSRSWGFPSPDSDYDIRFIYKHPKDWYLSPWEKKDTIEFMTEDDLDGSGWDLRKTLQLLNKSNVPLLEHLYSHLFYVKEETFLNKLKPLAEQAFSPITVTHHYLSIAKKYTEHCETKNVKLKDFFYCLRTTLAAKWVIEKGTFPPVIFHDMLELLPSEIQEKVEFLLKVKSENGEKYTQELDIDLIEYLKLEQNSLYTKAKDLRAGNLNKLEAERVFLEILNS